MTWQTGTATDPIVLLNNLRDIAINRHLASVVVDTAGTGYVALEVVTIAGGSGPYSATVEILTVGGSGEVLTARVETGGAYTSDPTIANNAPTGGSGTGLLLDLTIAATGWTIDRETEEVKTVVINGAGTGYAVNDTVSLDGGLGIGSSTQVAAAIFTVGSVDGGGGILTISISGATDGGIYEEPSTTLTNAGVTTLTGVGSGATVNVTFGVLNDRDKWLVLSGTAGGAGDSVTIAFRTFQVTAGGGGNSHNWAVFGLETFNVALLMEAQANLSPGIDGAGAIDQTQGAFVPLVESSGTTMQFWGSWTDRRIEIHAKCEQGLTVAYPSAHAGFVNQLGTAVEKPYPLFVVGSTSRHNTRFNETAPNNLSGISECYSGTLDSGPGWYYRTSDGIWQEVQNGTVNESTGTRNASTDCVVYPQGQVSAGATQPQWDDICDDGNFSWRSMFAATTTAPIKQLYPTPDTGGNKRLLISCALILKDDANDRFEIVGELDGLFGFDFSDIANPGSAEGVSEDSFVDGTLKYRVLQNGNRTNPWAYMAILEA